MSAQEPWLIVGAGGMLGRDLVAAAALAGQSATALTRADLDVTDAKAVQQAVQGHQVVFNAAAWTNVDEAESHEEQARAVNALGPANLAQACATVGARLIHVSTDYVFAGDAQSPYSEDAPMAPATAYGRTKAAGEQQVRALLPTAHVIVRTAWLYGQGSNFVATMARLERERETVSVVCDQIGQPTWAADLAQRLVQLAVLNAPAGTYHGTNTGTASWYELAQSVFAHLGADPQRVLPIATKDFPRPAPRPAYSVLGQAGWSVTGLEPLRPWQSALASAFAAGVFTTP